MLAWLIGAFPTCKIPEHDIYSRALLDQVLGLNTMALWLRAAVHHLIAERKFVPAIAEVLVEIAKQHEFWKSVEDASAPLTVDVDVQGRLISRSIFDELVKRRDEMRRW